MTTQTEGRDHTTMYMWLSAIAVVVLCAGALWAYAS